MSTISENKPFRVAYLDILRIIAAFMIVMIHASTETWGSTPVGSSAWNAMNLYDGVARWGVPVFVMISGALFLGREHTYRKLFQKNILHIVIVFLFWNLIYATVPYIRHPEMLGFSSVAERFFELGNHLWFLLMILGIYLIVPMLRKIVENEKIAWAFVILSFIFAVFLPQATELLKLFCDPAAQIVNRFVGALKLNFVLGYPGYFVLGYLLHKNALKKGVRITLYVLGVLGAASSVVGTLLLSVRQNSIDLLFYDYLTVNVFFTAVAAFVAVRQLFNRPMKTEKGSKRLAFLSRCTFGVYLIHPMLIQFSVNLFHFDVANWFPLISIPIFTAVIFAVSGLISVVMNKISIVKKWLV